MYRHCVPHAPGLCGSAGRSAQCQPVWRAPVRNPSSQHPAGTLPWHRAQAPPFHGLAYTPRPHAHPLLHRAQRDALQTTEDPLPNGAVNMLQAALSSIDLPGGSSLDSMDADDVLASLDGASDDNASHEHHHSAASVGRAVYEVLRIDPSGKTRRIYVRRRDLLRGYCLQPRDLRRIDPSLTPTKTSPSVTIKEQALLVNMGGVRAIISAGKCLLFEPNSSSSRRFLELVTPRLQTNAGELMMRAHQQARGINSVVEEPSIPPFELEMLEGALLVATGRLDNELLSVTRRVAASLQKLPKDINPVNLEELRRVKQILVELESKADALRSMLEELMDDEDDLRDMNLSSRPVREEKRRQRERERLKQEVERDIREREEREELLSRRSDFRAELVPVAQSSATAQAERRGEERGEDRDDDYADAEERLEEMAEAEEEERELEEVEDLLEYYLQRATTTQSEAERLLAGARDLEESIGVSLSARRFEVNRLELTLSICSFAAAVGAMVAGIFGMNLRSTLEMSVLGFWGVTGAIFVGCWLIYLWLTHYTKQKRIL